MRGILLILITLTSLTLINPWFTRIHPTYARTHSSTFQSASGTNITFVDPANVTNLMLTPESPLTLRPDGDGTFTDWTGSYTDWDEAGLHDGDTSYVSANAANQYESSTMEDHTSETWDIAKVKVTIYARTNIISDDKVTPFLYIGIWKYMGAGSTLTNETYTEYTAEWAINPDTVSNWTWSDIDALEVGVSADVGDDSTWDVGLEMRVTQLYVEVTGPRLSVDIEVDYVDDLWLYQYELTFNPDVLQAVWVNPLTPVKIGPFLGSAGGTVLENPGAGWNNTLGKLPITGAYLTQSDPTYCPDGGGVLSTAFFEVVAKGESELRLSEDTGLMDNNYIWVSYGRDHVQDGYFRNVAWGSMPKADFTITPVGTPEPLEGYNTTFTSTSTGGTQPYTYKWYLWKTLKAELFAPIVTSVDAVSRNYTTRGIWNVTLTVIDDDDVVGTKTGYVRIKAHDVFFSAVTTNATWGVWPSSYRADIGKIVEVNATAKNEGDYTETFDVSTFWSAFYAGEPHYGIIGTHAVTDLAAGASQDVIFTWDTEGRNLTHPEQIAVVANASRVDYEYDVEYSPGKISDNQFTGPVIRVRMHDIAVMDVSAYNYLSLKPAGDGTKTQWTGAYTDWDDPPPGHDGDGTYVKAAAKDLCESSTIEDHTAESWSIDRVRVTIVARTNMTTDEQVQLMLVIGGTVYQSSTKHTLTTTYSKYSSEWSKNPDTSSDWTWSNIDNLEAGVNSTQSGPIWTGEIRVTQLYVEVLGPGEPIPAGEFIEITVEVTNQGDFNQTSISVTAYYDNTAIDTQTIPLMTNSTFGRFPRFEPDNYTTVLTFLWETTNVGNVTIKAKATYTGWDTPGHAEEDYEPDDNTFINGWIKAGEAAPEFPLGMALEMALAVFIFYVWWKRRHKTKLPKTLGFRTR